MTRDEALGVVHKAFVAEMDGLRLTPKGLLDCIVELCMIKLGEPEREPIVLCGEDPDWNWWLLQTKEFREAAVKHLRNTGFRLKSDLDYQLESIALAHMPASIFREFKEELDRAGLQITEKGK